MLTASSFIHLITHRFASHCCEALFLRAAPVVTNELRAGDLKTENGDQDDADVSMETLFLNTLAELEGNIGYLMTERYASHTLRVLLVVLSGSSIDDATTKHLLQSKRKETNAIPGSDTTGEHVLDTTRPVPSSFGEALERVISDGVAGLDTEKLRALATHPNGNPTLQLLLTLELSHYGKQRGKDENSIIRTLLPDDPITADSDSAQFINGLVYDAIGSHLVEKIVQHAPAKMFKSLYSEFFKNRLAQHARNEIAGYVVCRVLERLGQDDLHTAHEELIPTITPMLQRGRTMIVRTLIERCVIRDIDTRAIAVQVNATWDGPDGFEVKKLLKWNEDVDIKPDTPQDSEAAAAIEFARSAAPMKAHFNILAQAMLLVPGSLSALVLDSLVQLDSETLINMSKDKSVSRTIQAALTSKNTSLITIRKLIQRFYGHMAELAIDVAASHVIDCMWEGTHGLAFIRERIAEELAENEKDLRESSCGRAVWKNWKMDLYKRRRTDWIRQSKVKASNDGFQSFSELDESKGPEGKPKTPLELARERHAKNKEKKERKRHASGGGSASGANLTSTTSGAGTSAAATASS
jgi:nucleolar protein 9